MQREAVERVRLMQQKAKERLDATNRMAAPPPAPAPPPSPPPQKRPEERTEPPRGERPLHTPHPPPPRPSSPPVHPPPPPGANPFTGILERLNLDGETILLLLLLILLLNDGADRNLLLALGYLIIA